MARKKRKPAAGAGKEVKTPATASHSTTQTQWRWRPLIASLIVLSVVILFLSWIKFSDLLSVDRYLQDLLITYVGRTEHRPFDKRVALILVDEANQPKPPFGASTTEHRKYHAELVRALSRAGARVIVFDVLFQTYSAEADPDFAQAIDDAGKAGTKVIVGAFFDLNASEPQLSRLIKNSVGDRWGIVDGATLENSDSRFIRVGATQSDQPFNGLDEQPVVPSLALQAVRFLNYPNEPTSVWFSPLAGQVRLRRGGAGGPLLSSIPVNSDLDLLIILPGKDEIPHYSYQEVLSHLDDYAGNFKDRIVVIGYQKDDKLPPSKSEKDTRYGAEIHATAMSTLLTGSFIKPLPVLYHYLFILALVAIAAYLQVRFSKWMEMTQTIPLPFLPAPINKITIPTPIFVVSLVYLLFAALAYKIGHVVFDMSYHLAALVLTYLVFTLGRSWLAHPQ